MKGLLLRVLLDVLLLTLELELEGLALEVVELERRSSALDLSFNLREEAGAIRGTVEYSRDLFEAETIERMLAYFVALAERIVSDPACRLSALPVFAREGAVELESRDLPERLSHLSTDQQELLQE